MSESDFRDGPGGHPDQNALLTGRAVFTEAYAVIPRDVMRDIVTSNLPHWQNTRAWIVARPMSGFSETFAQYVMEVAPGGGSSRPEPDPQGEAVLFVLSGALDLVIDDNKAGIARGDYAFVGPGVRWSVFNSPDSDHPARFVWIRKRYQPVHGISTPESFVLNEAEVVPEEMKDSGGAWLTTLFVDPDDIRHDMHVNIVTFEPGGTIPFMETHVMEHGIYVLEGKAAYRLNRDWVELEQGDFVWLRAFCPQACYAGGPGRFRYLLYKDVNRHPELGIASQ